MAQLSSPGVSVTVNDDSIYTASAAGTVPLIFVASASDKLNGSKTGIAPGTLASNDGKVYLLTSQKDLLDTFGTPVFKTDSNNNPIHAGEQNEYGLQAAYSYLGANNRAFVARASVNLDQLTGTPVIPTGKPVDGAFWLDTNSSHWGIFEWDSRLSSGTGSAPTGQTFINKVPTVITDVTLTDDSGDGIAPLSSVGGVGSYAIVAVSSLIKLWYKKGLTSTPAAWVEVGTADWVASRATVASPNVESSYTLYDQTSGGNVMDSIEINGTTIDGVATLAALVDAINAETALSDAGITAAAINNKLELYSTGVNIDLTGTLDATATKLGLNNGVINALAPAIYKAPALQISAHTAVPAFKRKDATSTANNRPTGSVWIKTTTINKGIDLIVSKYNAAALGWIPVTTAVYDNAASALNGLDSSGGGLNIAGNTIFLKTNDAEESPAAATFKFYRRSATGVTRIESGEIKVADFSSNTYTFTLLESVPGSSTLASRTVTIDNSAHSSVSNIINNILTGINNSVNPSNVHAVPVGTNKIAIIHSTGGEIQFEQPANGVISKLFSLTTTANFYLHPTSPTVDPTKFVASLWSEFTSDKSSSFITPSSTEPTAGPADGQLWYASNVEEVDIMVNDGTRWIAYRNFDHGGTRLPDPAGPFITPTKPTLQSTGLTLVEGDLWIDTSDLENYPKIYKYVDFDKQWELMDVTDQTTENGILFADARWNTSGLTSEPATIAQLLGGSDQGLTLDEIEAANFVDFDAPNPALYPKGMLLWNLRRSGFNVKKYRKNYVNPLQRNTRYENQAMTNYVKDMWVTESANQEDGSGSFGRKAQRKVVTQSLQALVNSNQQIRETESRVFNLIAAPGYPELAGEMRILNYDRGITAFVVADTPARLPANATDINNWGMNSKLATEDNDKGLTTFDPYVAFFYPWGYTSDNLGRNIVVPPSHMMLYTIGYNDNISYPWFAPAGTSRGVIKNADSTGYITSSGEFQTVSLNTGMRDTLAEIKVNPITYLNGIGLVNYAQYTRSSVTSSLDRINVARLVVYLRRQFEKLSRPYLFEPNDASTRNQIKHAAEVMLTELMGQRAINDFIVVCDGSNNTPDRIDRSELYLDVAIEPMKAVEFIYIPLRLKNTGEIAGKV